MTNMMAMMRTVVIIRKTIVIVITVREKQPKTAQLFGLALGLVYARSQTLIIAATRNPQNHWISAATEFLHYARQ